ncbi:MAG: Hsp70 family protein, partial [Planctomycetales bacterium]
ATVAGKTLSAEDLSSLVLRSLKEDAEAHLGETVDRAVITVPAYFNNDQRTATLRSGEMAGYRVERIINEPTAAAIAYGFQDSDKERVVAVLDLGGGTFDVSIVEVFDGALEVQASSGECFLGGEDFTRAMASKILGRHGHQFEHLEYQRPHLVSRMIQLCERAKRQLSSKEKVVVPIPEEDGDVKEDSPRHEASRNDFQEWIEPILGRLEMPIRRCLGDAGLKRADLDEVILVGGATRMPIVKERVAFWLEREPHSDLDPEQVVALGAGVQSGLIDRDQAVEDLVVTDVAPFTLGIEVTQHFGTEYRDGYFMPIINRNTTIPVSRVRTVTTLRANQTSLDLTVCQGESRRVEDNLQLGQFTVRGIPRGPAGQEVDVRFTYDLNGVLEVEATVVETRQESKIVIAKHTRGLTEAEIEKALEAMKGLKTHPRDEAVNRFMLKRAERVFRELSLLEREDLAQLMHGFEEAMELQESDLVERHRVELEKFLDKAETG